MSQNQFYSCQLSMETGPRCLEFQLGGPWLEEQILLFYFEYWSLVMHTEW